MELYVVDIFSDSVANNCELNPFLSEKSTLNRLSSAIGRYVLKCIASQKLEVDINSVVVEKGKFGKPYIKGDRGLHFNITHSDNLVIVAFDSEPLGIDAELLREVKTQNASRIFGERDNQYIFSSSKDISKRFLECWTRKEAVVKCFGESIVSDVRNRLSTDLPLKTIFYKNNVISMCTRSASFEYVIKNAENLLCGVKKAGILL